MFESIKIMSLKLPSSEVVQIFFNGVQVVGQSSF